MPCGGGLGPPVPLPEPDSCAAQADEDDEGVSLVGISNNNAVADDEEAGGPLHKPVAGIENAGARARSPRTVAPGAV